MRRKVDFLLIIVKERKLAILIFEKPLKIRLLMILHFISVNNLQNTNHIVHFDSLKTITVLKTIHSEKDIPFFQHYKIASNPKSKACILEEFCVSFNLFQVCLVLVNKCFYFPTQVPRYCQSPLDGCCARY